MVTKENWVFSVEEVQSFEKDILRMICPQIREVLKRIAVTELMTAEEIRLRANKPLMVQSKMGSFFVNLDGKLTTSRINLFYVSQEQIIKTLELISENSIYAFQDEIRNGFLTIRGGHRVGIAGRVVLNGDIIKNIKDVSGLNIRIAREVNGCSSKVLKYIISNEKHVYNTLIVSPPQCGKTTLLRDITRVISDGIDEIGFKGLKVGVIDERSEIAACYKGVPQNRVGTRTDVLDACPKQIGMIMMLRSMSPDVIVTDEIGSKGDKDALSQVLNAGVKVISTAHGYNISELKSRKEVLSLMDENMFERYIVLSARKGPGTVEEIIDGTNMSILYKGE
ncbi:stage III sporulation protein AA [Acetivibrio mesophilus]|uniref:Stage III sporulation protein AA n=1 Tax=Acetivibrio mesophilus TaxID=2487273 RepID=A0A4Q0I5P2_9FIRM|nr:stage III sporulation protein AA [Acetivibrio mesophilus]ODM25296.1 stage III sporulation protein AA [Clostridium sp. Bc-iso-3]RXE59684.1 stage III sporulation protein AA [Acetivibrio mesophilus]HHV28595.1 stage III sporulation protein AA [Clostridium sp.]